MFWSYFRSPFPKAEGFSAYRMPGMLVHFPVIIAFAVLGFWLCVDEPLLSPLLLVYVFVGLYVGRDLAILGHYSPLIAIVVLVGAFSLLGVVPGWPRPPPAAGVAATATMALLFAGYVRWRTSGETDREPPLYALIRAQDLKAIAAALERSANVNGIANDDRTPLQFAVEQGKPASARLLLEMGADSRRANRSGWTPLHAAVAAGDNESVEMLLAAGADINARSGSDHSILGAAAHAGRLELIPWLLERGAKAQSDRSAIEMLAGSKDPRAIETMKRLIKAGAQVSDDLLVPAATPEMIRFLAARGAQARRLPPGQNPAFTRGDVLNRPERLRALRELGCDLAAADRGGRTVLHDACDVEGASTLGAILVEVLPAGLDVNATDDYGETAIYRLVENVLPYVTGRNIVGPPSAGCSCCSMRAPIPALQTRQERTRSRWPGASGRPVHFANVWSASTRVHPTLQRLIDRIDNAAALPGDPPAAQLRKALLIFLGVAGAFLVPWGALYLARIGQSFAAGAALALALLCAAALAHLLLTKRDALAAWLELTGLLLAPFLVQWTMDGFAASGAVVLWSLLSPLCALVFQGTRAAVAWFAAFSLLVLALAARDIAAGADLQTVLLFCENVLLVSCLAFVALRFFIIERDRAQAALALEQERSERLLLNILPEPIAERLKAGQSSLADGYAEVTILFADLVGFTKMSATVTPERLVEVLNQLFSRFDELSERHGVEKIKTIGDAYMACAGVPVPRRDHAEAIAEMALDMCRALAEHNRQFASELKIRIGINTGPVVAGVIGLKKFIYDLWGDSVNLASRMESHGVPDAIQVSAATWTRLRERYDFVARGPIEVKGVGAVNAYLLKGRKGEPARPSAT